MLAEIIAIGSELLGSSRLDTNSLFLTRELSAVGIRISRKSVLPDDESALAAAIAESCRRVPLVICIGGLGPTEDDRTRAAAALALDCRLVRDPQAVERLRVFFAQRRRPMVDINLRQADRLAGAEWLPNPLGSAPGQWCPTPGGMLVLLPGPPQELQRMFAAEVRPRLAALAPEQSFFTRVLSIAGLSESEVDALAAPIYTACDNPQTTILATAAPQIELHFNAWGVTPALAQARADELAARVEAQLGDAVFSREQEPLAAVVGRLLREKAQTIVVAESCTGGMLGERFTQVPGASDYFLGGVICYSSAQKQSWLSVPVSILEAHGAVSEACACAMAEGVRQRTGADWGIAITGIAGPDGGTVAKPVGTVYIGFSQTGQAASAVALHLAGDRDRIRRFSVQHTLNHLRLRLLAGPELAAPN